MSPVGHPAPRPANPDAPAAADFSYVAPTTVAEAVRVLGPDARVLAGGQTLIPMLRLGLAHPRRVVDINGIAGLDRLVEVDGMLRIGALIRDADVERSTLIRERHPILHDAVRRLADPLIRSRSTLAGSLANGDPAGDWIGPLAVLGAELHVASADGLRVLPARGFQLGAFQTALRPDELITEVRVPSPQPAEGAAYVKVEQRAGDYAVAAVAVRIRLEGDVVAEAAIVLVNAGPVALDAVAAAAALVGRVIDDADAVATAAGLAGAVAEPITDLRGRADDKRQLLVVLVRRALRTAAERARAAA